MHPDTKTVHEHMREFGGYALGRAVYDSVFSDMTRPYVHAMAVVGAAHGAEIIIKSRIAQEHPLLIFDSLPKSKSTQGMLTVLELFEQGKTRQYFDLPEILWASTGYRMKNQEGFLAFGKLRNTIMHFAAPNLDFQKEVLKFAFEIIDPMMEDFWKESIINYTEIWDEVIVADGYLQEALEGHEIKNLTSTSEEVINVSQMSLEEILKEEKPDTSATL